MGKKVLIIINQSYKIANTFISSLLTSQFLIMGFVMNLCFESRVEMLGHPKVCPVFDLMCLQHSNQQSAIAVH